ncbi:MAG: cytochrome c [Trueperaceae bacterium]|nr:cytochrome c [Trueperaceae bacterium]
MRWSGPVGLKGWAARAGVCLVAVLALVAAAQEGETAGVAVSSGVYGEEQATVGAEVYSRRCSGCHGAELAGGFGPRLAPLSSFWHGRSLAELYSFVSQYMPFDAPGTLSAEEYAQAVAFILSRNGYPAGVADLAADAEVLAGFIIDAPQAE